MLAESALLALGNLLELGAEIQSGHYQAEMAVVSEWIIRDDRTPDALLTVFAAPMDNGEIQTACSCVRGTKDEPCTHALLVVSAIRSDTLLYNQLFRERRDTAA